MALAIHFTYVEKKENKEHLPQQMLRDGLIFLNDREDRE